MKTLADARDKAEIIDRLHQVTADSQRRWGRMTAHQMICHLGDSHRTVMGERVAGRRDNAFSRTVMKWLALKLPLQWPHGVKTTPENDQEIGGTKPAEFQRDKAELLQLVERFTASARDFQWAAHPLFGEMSDDEWMRWGYLHADHHLRQFGV